MAEVRNSEYIGRGVFKGIVKAFMPRRLGRRVAINGLMKGQGLLYSVSLLKGKEFKLTRPLNTGIIIM
jgi:hypothetical protein